jgi:hypothetical protein
VLAAERLHGDDTTVPILAKHRTIKGHIWTYVRDDRRRSWHRGAISWRDPPTSIKSWVRRDTVRKLFHRSGRACHRIRGVS